MTSLVLATHDGTRIDGATRATIAAAIALGGAVDLLVAGENPSAAAAHGRTLDGVRTVKVASAAHYKDMLAEEVAPLIQSLASGYSHLLAPANATGKDVMPRVAALLNMGMVSEITGILSDDTFVRPTYAGNAIATVQALDAVKVVTVRKVSFTPVGENGNASEETVPATAPAGLSEFIGLEASVSERPELTSARVVVSGGRGLGSKENFVLVEQLADALGAAVGASRAAVDMGLAPNDAQVGQTGKVVAPELYIACGISGAIQHLAGMKDSKVIVAINKDENAPMLQMADYGLVGDVNTVIPELIAALKQAS